MPFHLKPLHKQVFVITGATSLLGLTTAKMAVEQGAKVFMIDTHEEELQKIQNEMRAMAYDTAFAIADLVEMDQLQYAADRCIATFGRIDTWVNIAGVNSDTKKLDTEAEERRLFETHFWSVVNGSKIGVENLSQKGGALINIEGAWSQISPPMQDIFAASKQALKGYSDALREELAAQKKFVSLTLMMPSTSDNSEVAARSILKAAVKATPRIGFSSVLSEVKSQNWLTKGLMASGATFMVLKKLRFI
jgi:short-subunit dehydrogenase